jgi:hypothetical protein
MTPLARLVHQKSLRGFAGGHSDAGFMAVWRYVDINADSPNADAVVDRLWEEVQALVEPFDGLLDNFGFGEPGSAAREWASR